MNWRQVLAADYVLTVARIPFRREADWRPHSGRSHLKRGLGYEHLIVEGPSFRHPAFEPSPLERTQDHYFFVGDEDVLCHGMMSASAQWGADLFGFGRFPTLRFETMSSRTNPGEGMVADPEGARRPGGAESQRGALGTEPPDGN